VFVAPVVMHNGHSRGERHDHRPGLYAGHSDGSALTSGERMLDLFEPATRADLLARLGRLQPDSPRQWGTMDAPQMLGHCAAALQVATGDTPRPQALIGRLLAWTARKKWLGPEPFSRNSPTDPTFVVKDARDFAIERVRLEALIERFVALGPESAGRQMHSFFGRMTGEEWGCLMAKHLDHHLRQFGV
jgi:hypothetical protein